MSDARFATKKRKRTPSSSVSDNGVNRGDTHEGTLTLSTGASANSIYNIFVMPNLSPDAIQLLGIFAALGGVKVPRLLFERFLSPQLRWGENGYIISAAASDFDSDVQLKQLFERARLTGILEELLLSSWISVDNDNHLHPTYSILESRREDSLRRLGDNGIQHWTLLALQLSCHVFPRDPTWEERSVLICATAFPPPTFGEHSEF